MKRSILSIIIVITMVFSLTACGSKKTDESPATSKETTKETATVTEEATTDAGSTDLLNPANYVSDKEKSEWTIAVIVKDATSDWFKRMQVGVDDFGNKMAVNVIQKGPASADAASQVQLVEDMMNQGVDALCIIPIDPGALESVLEEAMNRGIVVVSHEASNLKNTLYDVEAFTAESFGETMMDQLAQAMGKKGKYAQMVAYTTSTTHMEYSNAEHNFQVENYPDMSLINDTVPSAESEEKVDTAYSKAKEILKANTDLAGFTGAASVDILGEAQAVEELGLSDQVSIVGVGTPNACKEYVHNGTISAVCLWDPALAGFAMCDVAYKILSGEEVGNGSDLECEGYNSVSLKEGINRCLLGNAPLILKDDNIDNYDF
ncbi:MAG: autoinducer 2 ABC transporter substrate-binding protein [Herbinix sp.]|nr:autoinducer 2 ABC transporter substrate-binding protein [Herbinix sp.]